ncbi:Rieske 2Fe-2S domain-containing protein [Yinghuangia seranimata]|uniref:Rieske 2Fe-2S domain-containing protein n=1 Tax=Yinghuangia seranimata TaxID=408067 RepID=UPI00248C6F05|nr:Rieske 2Fe-2S domain-containing protein [Yinghuangia seranimata]MDI2130074.1 Rieske 2Fe-2S domain-containing protein [Yinghuangia seranimata]
MNDATSPPAGVPVPVPVHTGWHLIAFTTELTGPVTPLALGRNRLVAVRGGEDPSQVRVFDATCPHRGAHLGYGGKLSGEHLICPFHGRRIALGGSDPRRSAAEHPTITWGEAVFVRLGDDPADDRGFTRAVKELSSSYSLVGAVSQPVSADPALVVENAFDLDHFTALHKVPRIREVRMCPDVSGELAVEARFMMTTSPWRDDRGREQVRWRIATTGVVTWDYQPRFYARAFSPGVVVTEFGPDGDVHVIVTGAVPAARGGSTARVAVGVRAGREADLPMLVVGSKRALAEDALIWDHLDTTAPAHYGARDRPVLAYHAFCRGFGDVGAPGCGEGGRP